MDVRPDHPVRMAIALGGALVTVLVSLAAWRVAWPLLVVAPVAATVSILAYRRTRASEPGWRFDRDGDAEPIIVQIWREDTLIHQREVGPGIVGIGHDSAIDLPDPRVAHDHVQIHNATWATEVGARFGGVAVNGRPLAAGAAAATVVNGAEITLGGHTIALGMGWRLDPADPWIGRRIAGYRLRERLPDRGRGVGWSGWNREGGRGILRQVDGADAAALDRVAAASAPGDLGHRHFLLGRLVDDGHAPRWLLEPEPWRTTLARAPFTPRPDVVAHLVASLALAARLGVPHDDIGPHTVLVDDDGALCLDFSVPGAASGVRGFGSTLRWWLEATETDLLPWEAFVDQEPTLDLFEALVAHFGLGQLARPPATEDGRDNKPSPPEGVPGHCPRCGTFGAVSQVVGVLLMDGFGMRSGGRSEEIEGACPRCGRFRDRKFIAY